jgi:O-methyltransferase involved in polyketide biosynthesis
VVPYLTLEAFHATVSFIAAQRPGSGLTLDYGQPRSALPLLEQMAHDSLASRVEKAGEPFQLFFTPPEIAAELSYFHNIEDLGAPEINARYFSERSDELKMRGTAGRFLSAWL